jgi:hypothetical protein
MVSAEELQSVCDRITRWYGAMIKDVSQTSKLHIEASIVCTITDVVLIHTTGFDRGNESIPCFTVKHFIDACLLDKHLSLENVSIPQYQPYSYRVVDKDAFTRRLAGLSSHDLATGRVDLLTQACGIYSFDEVNQVIIIDEDEYNNYKEMYLQQSKEDIPA